MSLKVERRVPSVGGRRSKYMGMSKTVAVLTGRTIVISPSQIRVIVATTRTMKWYHIPLVVRLQLGTSLLVTLDLVLQRTITWQTDHVVGMTHAVRSTRDFEEKNWP